MSSMSEDAMFKALLKNKPPQKPKKKLIKEIPDAELVHENESLPVKNTNIEVLQTNTVEESIKSLSANVNTLCRLMKSVIAPVLVLILIIGIAVLIKL